MKIFPDKGLIALSLIMTIIPVGDVYSSGFDRNKAIAAARAEEDRAVVGGVVISTISYLLLLSTAQSTTSSGIGNHAKIGLAAAVGLGYSVYSWLCAKSKIEELELKKESRYVHLGSEVHIGDGFVFNPNDEGGCLNFGNGGHASAPFNVSWVSKDRHSGYPVNYHVKSNNSKEGFSCEGKNGGCWCLRAEDRLRKREGLELE